MSEKNEQPKIWIGVSETINTGAYESVKIEAGYSRTYEKEDPIELIDSGVDELRKAIKKKAKQIRKKSKKK